MWVAFAKATQFFSAKIINVCAIFNDQSFNDTLTYNIVSFEQLGHGIYCLYPKYSDTLKLKPYLS